jgi:hypothetical protein
MIFSKYGYEISSNTNFIVFGFTQSGLEPTIHLTQACKLTITRAKTGWLRIRIM